MPAPIFTEDDYLRALATLMPRGRAWATFDGSVQQALLRGLVGVYVQSNIRASDLISEIFPPTTFQLLGEWESTLGLPDPCADADQTIAQRVGQVVARFSSSGSQSVQSYVDYAASLGFAITIVEDAPFRMGESVMGDHLGADDWMLVWYIDAPLGNATYFLMGIGAMGDPLASFDNSVLECEMEHLKPAHTHLIFRYVGVPGMLQFDAESNSGLVAFLVGAP